MKECVIVVPGIMGSVLRAGEEVVWPGSLPDLLGGLSAARLEKLLGEGLVATDLIRSYFISRQYQALLDDLTRIGFREHADSPTLFTCPYDWRLSNEVSAETLARRIEEVSSRYQGELGITLLAHSMGGLVSRYYLESGRFEGREGLARVKALITLGTPHRGAPKALAVVLGKERELWLSAAQAARLANDPRYPSAYQLLPPPGEPFAWSEDPERRLAAVDLHDEAVGAALGLRAESLASAREFHAALRGPRPGVRYFCFSGTQQATAALARIRRVSEAEHRVRLEQPDESGDGTVPSWSSVLAGVQGLPVGGEHGTLYKSTALRRTLAALLGAPGVLAAAGLPPVELALRDRVVSPGAGVRGVISFPPARDLQGTLQMERALTDPAGQVMGFAPAGPPHTVEYRGLTAESIGVVFDAPRVRGAYRVGFRTRDGLAATDELFVQES